MIARDLGKCKLYILGVQEVRWDRDSTERAEDCTFFNGEQNEDHQLGTIFFIHKRMSAVKTVDFISVGMLYIILSSHWYNIIVLNVHSPCEDATDDIKDSLYEDLGCVLDQFPRYDMKILVDDLNANVGKEDILKLTIGNGSSHEISNDNGDRAENFVTFVVRSTMFHHCNIHKYTCTSPEGKTHIQIHLCLDRQETAFK
jgi:hypothetical protein